jgi:hypothetical protein
LRNLLRGEARVKVIPDLLRFVLIDPSVAPMERQLWFRPELRERRQIRLLAHLLYSLEQKAVEMP